jgi:transposase
MPSPRVRTPVETDATRMCQLLVGLPTVTVLGVLDEGPDSPIVVHVETVFERLDCPSCGTPARVKDRDPVTLVDLPAFGRPARLVWRKRRWSCPQLACLMGSWTEHVPAGLTSPWRSARRSSPIRQSDMATVPMMK